MSVYSDLLLSYSPMAYFPLDETDYPAGGPGLVLDRTGHGFVGASEAAPGGPVPFAGSGPSTRFDGFVGISLSASLPGYALDQLGHGGRPFSYEIWAQPVDNSLGGGAQGGGELFAMWAPGIVMGTWSAWVFDADPQGTSQMHNVVHGGVSFGGSAGFTPDLRDGAWHHLVHTWDGTGTAVYLDGTALALQLPDLGAGFVTDFIATQAGIGNRREVFGWSGNLAHVSLYPRALTACQVRSLYDAATTGAYTPCLDWIRLRHAQTHDVCYETDSLLTHIKAGGITRLTAPLPVLSSSPDLLVGKDPLTGVPAFCPPPAVTSSVPVPPVVVPPVPVPPGVDACMRTRCGAAVALQTKLARDYDQWRQWINMAVNAALGGLIAAVLVELAAFLAAIEVAAWILEVFNIVKPFIGGTTVALLPGLIPELSAPQIDFLLHVFYCQLQCAGGTVSLDAQHMRNASALFLADHGTFPSDLQRELIGEIAFYEPLQDWQAAMVNAGTSDLCDGMSCS